MARSPVTANPTWVSRHPMMRYIHAYLSGWSGKALQARSLCDELLDEVADGDVGARVQLPLARRALASALSVRGRAADAEEVRSLRSTADEEDRALGLAHRIPARLARRPG